MPNSDEYPNVLIGVGPSKRLQKVYLGAGLQLNEQRLSVVVSGSGVVIYEQSEEPTEANAGDFWIEGE
jgi:hypothetical protein